jgi:hypothetical protein
MSPSHPSNDDPSLVGACSSAAQANTANEMEAIAEIVARFMAATLAC